MRSSSASDRCPQAPTNREKSPRRGRMCCGTPSHQVNAERGGPGLPPMVSVRAERRREGPSPWPRCWGTRARTRGQRTEAGAPGIDAIGSHEVARTPRRTGGRQRRYGSGAAQRLLPPFGQGARVFSRERLRHRGRAVPCRQVFPPEGLALAKRPPEGASSDAGRIVQRSFFPLPCRTVICSYSKSRSLTRNRRASEGQSLAP